MASADILSGLNFLMPIFSFLFVWIVVYALLTKTKVLGDNKAVSLFISALLAVFFIVNVNMQNYLNFNAAWVAVFLVCLFLILTLITFTHGSIDVIKKPWFAWTLVIILVLFFIISSAHFFSWTFNFSSTSSWFDTGWFGFVLLLLIVGVISWVLSK